MTRKKFVKQLMALGVSRNRANALAKHARNCGSYQTALQYERVRITAQNIVDSIVHGIRTIAAPPLQDFANRFLEAYNNASARFRQTPAIELPRLYALDTEDALEPDAQWMKAKPHFGIGGTARYEEPTEPGGPTLITRIDIREVSLIPDNMYPLGGAGE